MSKSGKFALGAIVGAAAGVVAGILAAPKSGVETRADIKHKADELKSRANTKAEEAKHKAAELKTEATHKADDLKARTERAAKSVHDAYTDKR